MKRIILAASLLAPGFVFAQSFNYNLKVQLKSFKKPAVAYLLKNFGWTNQKTIDSVMLKNGLAEFKGTLEEPTMVHLLIDHNGTGSKWAKNCDAIPFYLEKGKISIKGKDSVKTAQVEAGIINKQLKEYNNEVLVLYKRLAAQPAIPDTGLKGRAVLDSIMKLSRELNAKTDTLKLAYIRKNPGSFMSLVALKELAGKNMDVHFIEPLFNSLSPGLRKNPTAQDFAKKLEAERRFAIGAMAPDFTQNDVNGKPVKLSDFRGKYVLVDFWASWCGPCRRENPNLVKAYQAFRDKNFTVLGVSLDMPGKKEAWQEAIEKDGLAWTHVSDLKGWKNEVAQLYNVRFVPQNYLIDPNGKIVAKNLREERLFTELQRILE